MSNSVISLAVNWKSEVPGQRAEKGRTHFRDNEPCLTIADTKSRNHTFALCVVVAVRNVDNGTTNFLVGLLDCGCTGLVISSYAAKKLGVETWNEVVTIKVLEETTCCVRKNCKIDIFSLDDDNTQYLGRRAILVDSIPISPEAIPSQSDLKKYDYMHDIQLITPPQNRVDLIISVDMAATWCLPRDFRRGLAHQPLAILTAWGWALIGGETPSTSMISSFLVRVHKDLLGEKLDRIFNEDFKSIPGDKEIDKYSREDIHALSVMEQSIRLEQNRYIASAPWKRSKDETLRMMDSIDSAKTAKKRLESLGRRMDRDPEFKEKIFSQIENLESKDYIERVPFSQMDVYGKWYAPLHPVIKPQKPDNPLLPE